MGRHLEAAVNDAGTLVAGHLWLILAAAVVPMALACITSVVLVLSVDRSKRVEAIKALPPVMAALNQPAASYLRALEARNKSASPEGKQS
jgi:hypothetical protein